MIDVAGPARTRSACRRLGPRSGRNRAHDVDRFAARCRCRSQPVYDARQRLMIVRRPHAVLHGAATVEREDGVRLGGSPGGLRG